MASEFGVLSTMFGPRRGALVSTCRHVFVAAAFGLSLAIPLQSSQAASKYAAIVVDAKTGKTIFSRNADAHRYPASLTKIMTLYIVFEELEKGRLSESTRMKVSKFASRQAPSKLGLRPGKTIHVRDAIRALVTKSANDVAVVVAEHISGSQAAFARRMTGTARRLGMSRTTFYNPHGLPNSRQRTTARDMARLGRAIQERFPKRYGYFATRSFKYGRRRYRNHNKLLGRVRGVDGIKTGYTRASGFNLVSSVKTGGRHIVAVVMGGKTGRRRDAHMRSLISRYLNKASRGRKTAWVIRKSTRTAKRIPLPRPAPAHLRRPATTAVASASASASPVPRPRTPTMQVASAFQVVAPSARRAEPTFSVDSRVSSAGSQNSKMQAMASASAEPKSRDGWLIQIGALPTKVSAVALLDKAQARTGRTLNGRDPYTEAVQTKNQRLYRARFAGFQSKSSARAACAALKRRNFDCLTLRQ